MSYNELITTDVIAIEINRISAARIALVLLLIRDIHSRLKLIELDINFTFLWAQQHSGGNNTHGRIF